MVTPLRPSLTPPTGQPGASSAGGAARTAAQRAFFDAAMGRAAPAAPAATPAPAVQAKPAAPVAPARPAVQATGNPAPAPPPASGDEPVRYRRPGSILDIKV